MYAVILLSDGRVIEDDWSISSTEIQTITAISRDMAGITDENIDSAELWIYGSTGILEPEAVRLYETYMDIMYVTQPVLTLVTPTTGFEFLTTNEITATWANTLDADGGVQAQADIRVFREEVAAEGGFNVLTSPAVESRQVTGTATTFRSAVLANGNYRVYVRSAQSVLGTAHWSEFRSARFVVNILPPQSPTMTITEEREDGRLRLNISPAAALRTNPVTNPRGGALVTTGWTNVNLRIFSARTLGTEGFPASGGGLPAEVTTAFKHEGTVSGSRAMIPIACRAGLTYTISTWTYIETLSTATEIDIFITRPEGAGSIRTVALRTLRTWTRQSVTFTAEADGAYQVRTQQVGAGAAVWYATGWLAENSAALGSYFDGDTRNFQWTGAAHASTSTSLTIDRLTLERSLDGGATWLALRTVDGEGLATPISEGLFTAWDYEAPNSQAMRYRVRTGHIYSTGSYAWSEWFIAEGRWESLERWLKHPTNPALNMSVDIFSYPDSTRTARQGVFQPLDSEVPIVVSDTPSSNAGTIAFWSEGEAKEALDALFDSGSPLLLQMLPTDKRPDRWMMFSSNGRQYAVDKIRVGDSIDTLPWIEVARP